MSQTAKEKKLAQKAKEAARIRKQNIITWSVIAVLAIALVFLILALCGIFSSNEISDGDYVPPITETDENTVFVKMTVKDYGDIVLLLDGTSAPITVANFVKLVNEGFYDGLTFHRIIEDFMIQGGDPNGTGTGGSSETIKGEFELNGYDNPIKHSRGVISMARSSAYDSASSQFFICNSDSASVQNLDGSYAAFGCVVEGIGIVDKITEDTVKYASASSGTISDKSEQAVIEKVVVLDNYEYNP